MIRGVFAWLVCVLATAACAAIAIVWNLVKPGSDATFRMARVWSRLILRAAGVEARLEGGPIPAGILPCVFMSNHESFVDIWVLTRFLPESSLFLAKRSLFRIPLLGWAMAAGGFVPIDRRDRHSAISSLSLAARRVREGKSLVVFPEGTRSRDGRLGAFKKGPFHLAIESARPIVPLVIRGSRGILRPDSVLLRPGTVIVRVLPPIDPVPYGGDGLAPLMADVRRRFEESLSEEAS